MSGDLGNRQRGLASVEAALFLPVFLVLIFLMIGVAQLMLSKLLVIENARYSAWAHTYGINSTLQQVIIDRPEILTGEPILPSVEVQDANRNADLISEMRRAGCRDGWPESPSLTQVIDNDRRGISLSRSQSLYIGLNRFPEWSFFRVRADYGVTANRIWERQQLPVGYDNYMRRELNSQVLFTDLFPRAGSANSGRVRGGC